MFTIIRSSKLKDIESRLSQLEAVSGRVAMKEVEWMFGHHSRMITNILKKLDKQKCSNSYKPLPSGFFTSTIPKELTNGSTNIKAASSRRGKN